MVISSSFPEERGNEAHTCDVVGCPSQRSEYRVRCLGLIDTREALRGYADVLGDVPLAKPKRALRICYDHG